MFMQSRLLRRLVAGCIPLIAAPALLAQGSQTGTLAGSVKDETGKAIGGATIVLRLGQGDRTVRTDDAGAYRIPLLIPGAGRLQVSAPGFISAAVDLRVNVDRTNVQDVVLKRIPESGSTVEVVSSSEKLIDSTDAKSGANISLDVVNSLPINNRTIATIALQAPGTSVDGNGNVTIRGAQGTQVGWLVDGADVSDPVTGGPAVRLNEDFLEEVQVISGGVSAEYGRTAGGIVNTVTKSGTNEFHGASRFELTNQAWNAYNPLSRGRDGLTTFKNSTTTVQNYVVTGPILKDHLFFAVAYRVATPPRSIPGTTTSGDFGGVGFVRTDSEDRKDLKLDWQINSNHRVSFQYNKAVRTNINLDYPTAFGLASTSIATLSSQTDEYTYATVNYLGTLSDSFLLDVRYSEKKETLGGSAGPSGGQGPKNAPLWLDLTTGDIFDNGFFDNSGDARPVKTLNIGMTKFFDAKGSHELKFGLQTFESKNAAANAQTPSNYIIYFAGFNAPGNSAVANRVLVPNDGSSSYLEYWKPYFGAEAKTKEQSLYFNDKWKVNDRLSFNLGLRYDRHEALDDLGKSNFKFSQISPRLAAIYDVDGKGHSVFNLQYGEYLGLVTTGTTGAATPAGTPGQYDYEYIGGDPLKADGSVNLAAFSADPFYVNDTATLRTTTVDPNLKAPLMREIAVQYSHTDGKTSWSINVSKRTWTNFVDDFQTYDPGRDLVLTRIANDSRLRRDYWGVELVWQRRFNESLTYGLNATLAQTKGNYEGGQVGTTDQVNNFGPGNEIPREQLAPQGFLTSDVPLTIIANATYRKNLGIGVMNLGALWTYASGAPYSLTGGGTATPASLQAQGYASTYLRYFGDRGSQRFPDFHRLDLQLGYDLPLWAKVSLFGRVNVQNLFNHQLLATWNTAGTTSATGRWTAGANYGRPTSAANYIAARNLNFAFGLRF